jgi:hypothetical protein
MAKLDGLGGAARVAANAGLCAMLWGCGPSETAGGQASNDAPALGHILGLTDRGEPLTADERKEVLSILRVQGVDVSQAQYTADDILMTDGDLMFDARRVLESAREDVEKGYFWKNTSIVSNYTDIHVAPNPTYPPDAIWTWAVVYGGSDWNAHTHVAMSTAAPGPNSAIMTVWAFDFAGLWDPAKVCNPAWTFAPSGGQPGYVLLNTTYHYGPGGCTNQSMPQPCRVASLDSFTWDQMVHITTHEMGHSLGFAHPADNSGPGEDHIPGTQSAANPDNPTYPSVMWGGLNGCYPSGNANVTAGLSADDIASANAKYPNP